MHDILCMWRDRWDCIRLLHEDLQLLRPVLFFDLVPPAGPHKLLGVSMAHQTKA